MRDYYATQGVHLELRATEAAMIGRRGGLWGVTDALRRAALAHLEVGSDPTPARGLVAGIALGDTGAIPSDKRDELRSSGLYHLVTLSDLGHIVAEMQLDAYVRVSSTRDREETLISPELQRKEIEEYCRRHGHTVAMWHQDLNESGSRENRPEFQAALERIDRRETDGLIVARLDRFSRNVVGALTTIHRIEKAGGQLVILDLTMDTTTPSGRAFLGMLLVFAQLHIDNVRQTWSAAQRHAVENGVHIASKTPTGYRRGDDRRLEIVPEYAPVIADAFRARAAGVSYSELSRRFERAGVTGPYGSPTWTSGAMRKLLQNPVYLGQARSGRHVLEDAHPAIVSETDWRAAQSVRGVVSPPRSVAGQLLSGLIRCAGCRYVMKPDTQVSHGQKRRQYRCRGEHAAGKCSAPASVLASIIEPYVVQRFFEELGPAGRLGRQSIESDTAEHQREYEDALAQLELFMEHTHISDTAMYTRQLKKREKRVEEAHAALAMVDVSLPDAGDLERDWPELSTIEQRKLLASGIDAIMVRQGRDLGGRVWFLLAGEMAENFPRRGRRVTLAPFDFPGSTVAGD